MVSVIASKNVCRHADLLVRMSRRQRQQRRRRQRWWRQKRNQKTHREKESKTGQKRMSVLIWLIGFQERFLNINGLIGTVICLNCVYYYVGNKRKLMNQKEKERTKNMRYTQTARILFNWTELWPCTDSKVNKKKSSTLERERDRGRIENGCINTQSNNKSNYKLKSFLYNVYIRMCVYV